MNRRENGGIFVGDQTVVNMFWQRSEEAITRCEALYGAYCQTIAYNILRSVQDAKECVNETWLKAWNAIPPARPRSLKTYLGRISRNLALDRYEKAHAKKRGGGEVDIALEELASLQAPETSEEGEIARIINGFLHQVPAEHGDMFVKRYWYLMTVKEIACQYDCSTSKVTSILFRMRRRLRLNLESEGLM